MTANLLLAILAVQIFFGVSEGLTLTECTSGCLYVDWRTTNIVTCEGFQVNDNVTWEVFYTPPTIVYMGTCNTAMIGTCSPIQPGFNATVLPAGNASHLTIDLSRASNSLDFYVVRCSSGGKTVNCTLRYAACPSTTDVSARSSTMDILVTASRTEFIQNTSARLTSPPSFPSVSGSSSNGEKTTYTTILTGEMSVLTQTTSGTATRSSDLENNVEDTDDSGSSLPVAAIVSDSSYDHPQPRADQEDNPYTDFSVSRDGAIEHTQHDYVNMATPEHNSTPSTADNHATDGAIIVYMGTCNAAMIGTCSPIQPGFNATVLPAGNASVLTIDLSRVNNSLDFHVVRCSSGGQTVSCTLRYAACPPTTAVNTTPSDTATSTEFVQNITTRQTPPTSSYTDSIDTSPSSPTIETSTGGETTHTTGADTSPKGGVTTKTSRGDSTSTGGSVKPTDDTDSNGGKQGDSRNELPVGAIAGGVGAFVVVVIIAVIIFIRKRRGANKDTNNPYVNVEGVQQSTEAGHKVTTDAAEVLHDANPDSGLYAVVDKNKKTRQNTPRDVGPIGSQTELVSNYAQADFHYYAQVNDNRGANIGDSDTVQADVRDATGGIPLSEMYATVQKGNEDGYTAISLVPRASTGGGRTPELGQGPADGQYNVLNFTDRRGTLDEREDDYSHIA
ncbi:hypothetical protein BaRGS_00038505 [Batillaria attramentaria]|uniref:Mid2 domain-containing protein n=1 Tax=Batillaria attramentaria TaxID=370345 RepID=A0ABD0J6N2_9CAEN